MERDDHETKGTSAKEALFWKVEHLDSAQTGAELLTCVRRHHVNRHVSVKEGLCDLKVTRIGSGSGMGIRRPCSQHHTWTHRVSRRLDGLFAVLTEPPREGPCSADHMLLAVGRVLHVVELIQEHRADPHCHARRACDLAPVKVPDVLVMDDDVGVDETVPPIVDVLRSKGQPNLEFANRCDQPVRVEEDSSQVVAVGG